MNTLSAISDSIMDFLGKFTTQIGDTGILALALIVSLVIVIFYLVKNYFTYGARLNRTLVKLINWLYSNKQMTEQNVKEFNKLVKSKGPKQLTYYWQQYILFREGTPSSYMSEWNVIEKPLKASAFENNVKDMIMWTSVWSAISAGLMIVYYATNNNQAVLRGIFMGVLLMAIVLLIGTIGALIFRARKHANLNRLYRNLSLFNRFMDNACQGLPVYIDYQMLFTATEIEKGVPVLREFLDSRARKEKEQFEKNQARTEDCEKYNFEKAGIDGSLVLDRAMAESEKYLKSKEKILASISQVEAELESRKRTFENTEKDYQKRLQASRENVTRLRQQQEESTNRIESNFLRKQQTTEIGKQEQLEQELEQQKTKYVLDKNECEQEIAKLNATLEENRNNVTAIMMSEYQTFYQKLCQNAQQIVEEVIKAKINKISDEKDEAKLSRTDLEYKIASLKKENRRLAELVGEDASMVNNDSTQESNDGNLSGNYDENGNYIFENGTYYDTENNYHDLEGNVYDANGNLLRTGEVNPFAPVKVDDNAPVDFDKINYVFDDNTRKDMTQMAGQIAKEVAGVDVYDSKIDKDDTTESVEAETEPNEQDDVVVEDYQPAEELTEPQQEPLQEKDTVNNTKPVKKAGRPRKIVGKTAPATPKPKGKVGRPRKVVSPEEENKPKRGRGRPRKEVSAEVLNAPKRGRGRPKKQNDISTINSQISEEENKLASANASIENEIDNVITNLSKNEDDEKREQIMAEFENLKQEVERVKNEGGSDEEIAKLNSRIEELISQLTELNS